MRLASLRALASRQAPNRNASDDLALVSCSDSLGCRRAGVGPAPSRSGVDQARDCHWVGARFTTPASRRPHRQATQEAPRRGGTFWTKVAGKLEASEINGKLPREPPHQLSSIAAGTPKVILDEGVGPDTIGPSAGLASYEGDYAIEEGSVHIGKPMAT